MVERTHLVIGASGVIGAAHVRRLAGRAEDRVIALARRPPTVAAANVSALALDLRRPEPVASDLEPVTHAVFCAFGDASGWEAQRTVNTALFSAALDLLRNHCPRLIHVTLLQGMKAYGSHLGPFRTPARESDPRVPQGHYYYDQEDLLAESAARRGWRWTILRPHVVIGPARRSPQNLAAVLATYAAIRRSQGLPLAFPGPPAAFDALYQATDADLLSKAIEWAGTLAVSGETFNITNGDFFRWRHVWPKIASVFEMEAGAAEAMMLRETMSKAGPLWDRLVVQHGLEPNRLDELVSWPFADYVFGTTWDVMADTLKCRRHGFLEFLDSEQMLVDRLREMRDLKIVP